MAQYIPRRLKFVCIIRILFSFILFDDICKRASSTPLKSDVHHDHILTEYMRGDFLADEGFSCDSASSYTSRNYFGNNRTKVEILGDILKRHVLRLRQTPNAKVDLVFLVDSSTSVGRDNFVNELKFVKKLLADFTVDRNSTRVAVVTFSSAELVIRHIDYVTTNRASNHKCSLLEKELPAVRFTGGGTDTLGALEEAEEIFQYARTDSHKAIFLITDGKSNDGDPKPAAALLRQHGIEIFTFGIVDGNFKELCDMSSEPKHEHIFILDSFEEFEALARRALHEDLQSGSFISQPPRRCNKLCIEGRRCCDVRAQCECGTLTGKYQCVCHAGYYGSGLQDRCHACPSGTYKNTTESGDISTCTRCPDENHVSPVGSTSIMQCRCRAGYRKLGVEPYSACAVVTCPRLIPPENGYFTNDPCSNVYNAACGVACRPGYRLHGSSVRLCTMQGTWTGTSPTCAVKRCKALNATTHLDMQCTESDFSFGTSCHFSCDIGYKMVGSVTRECLANTLWSGVPASCSPVMCSGLESNDNVTRSPSSCTSESLYGTTCDFTCDSGYRLIGDRSRRCAASGQWEPPPVMSPQCIDVQPPIMTCPRSIFTAADDDRDTAHVSWTQPVVTDNSIFQPALTVIPAMTSPHDFPIGLTKLTYTAKDLGDNTAECFFFVTVEDTQAPQVDICISPSPFVSQSTQPVHITWQEPLFSDNSGGQLTITRTHNPDDPFPLGTTNVFYTATDESGNNSTCTLEIIVKEHACANPIMPAHGSLECNTQENSVECTPVCKPQYGFAIKPAARYVCQLDSGVWSPQDKFPAPDCSSSRTSNHVMQNVVLDFRSTVTCKDGLLLNQAEAQIIRLVKNKVDAFCWIHTVCSVDDIQIACLPFNSRHEDERIRTNLVEPRDRKRNRRAIADSEDDLNQNTGPDDTDRRSSFQVSVAVSIRTQDTDMGDNDALSLEGNLTALMARLNESALNGEFDVTVATAQFVYHGFNVDVNGTEFVCPPGEVLGDTNCVNCPVRTFFNVQTGACEACPRGTYQHEEAQLTCLVCPDNTSTSTNGSRNLDECKGLCLPGTFSASGLETCESCPIGYYQPEYAQETCHRCPGNTTTWRRRSRHERECGELCPRGYVSKSGLLPCFPCPRGYFQSLPGKSACFLCPGGVKTAGIGSVNLTECEGITETSLDLYESIPTTELVINECFAEPCENNGTCVSLDHGFICRCLTGWSGLRCEEEVDECASFPCRNNATCHDLLGSFSCDCSPGHQGEVCELDINECLSAPCLNNATCIDHVDGYSCSCLNGFSGVYCENNIDECANSPCENGAVCVDGVADYECVCADGYSGRDCEIQLDECESSPCHANATCVDLINAFSCTCPDGFTGVFCGEEINECDIEPCDNDATCINHVGYYTCVCPPSFTGSQCETKLNSSFDLNFNQRGEAEYAVIDEVAAGRDIRALTVSMWLNTNDRFINYGTPVSYATDSEENAFSFTDYSGFVLNVNGELAHTEVWCNDGNWHHMVVTWEGETGHWVVYKDGVIASEANAHTALSRGYPIPGGGAFVVGQEQDRHGGGFSSQESYIGTMTRVNVWNEVMSTSLIQDLRHTCDEHTGSLIAWPDFLAHVNGDVIRRPSSFCQPCPEPVITHGEARYTSLNQQGVAHYTCNTGYKIEGPRQRTCGIESLWEGPQPSCTSVECPSPPQVANGLTYDFIYSYNYTVTYSCFQGHSLLGSDTLYCNADGEWEGETPVCAAQSCEAPSSGPGMVVTPRKSRYLPDEVVQLSCDRGFFLAGRQSISCTDTGQWNFQPSACVRVICSNPPVVEHARLRPDQGFMVVFDSRMYYECEEGYTFVSTSHVTCEETGRWSDETPQCVIITCDHPGYITNGGQNGSSLSVNSIIRFSCDLGFIMEGSSSIHCMADGMWNSTLPQCQQINCIAPQPIRHGVVSHYGSFSVGSRLHYECDDGHVMIGRMEWVCLLNGSWSGTPPTCQPVQCPHPPEVDHGYQHDPEQSGIYVLDSIATFRCYRGYILSGDASITCTADGIWGHEPPSCVPVQCTRPVILDNVMTSLNGTTFGEVIEYSCFPGYRLVGAASQTCMHNGTWSDNPPMCEEIICNAPPITENGLQIDKSSYTVNMSINYQCKEGFRLTGNSRLLCGSDGLWQGQIPTCGPVNCSVPDRFSNGYIVTQNGTHFGSKVNYVCDPGYELLGSSLRICTAAGVWSESEPVCQQILCQSPMGIPNGYLHVNTSVFEVFSKIYYSCKSGYEMKNVSTRTCQENGSWTGVIPECLPVNCAEPNRTIIGGIVHGKNVSYNATIQYVCHNGFTLVGDENRTCLETGEWDVSEPNCIPVVCPAPGTLLNGSISGEDNSFNSTITYDCNEGFVMVGEKHSSCMATGVWSTDQPVCNIVICPPITEEFLNGVVIVEGNAFGDRAVYECDGNYIILGTDEIFCSSNATWTGSAPTCRPTRCDGAPHIKYGEPLKSFAFVGDRLFYLCQEGYELVGSGFLTCNTDGKFSGENPQCRQITCDLGDISLPNGSVHVESNDVGSLITYSCDSGFNIVGPEERLCSSDGEWSGSPPVCERVLCPELFVHQNGFIVGNSTEIDSVVYYGCSEGYRLVGNEYRECSVNGKWSGSAPRCEEITCAPLHIDNALIELSSEYSEQVQRQLGELNRLMIGIKLNVSCEEGFSLHGPQIVICLRDGNWSNPGPSCERNSCQVPNIPNGYMEAEHGFQYESRISVECTRGHELVGASEMECQADGEWDELLPMCAAVVCGEPLFDNGSFTVIDIPNQGPGFHFSMTLQFVCSEGFELVGQDLLTCMEDKAWSSSIPKCVAVVCDPPLIELHHIPFVLQPKELYNYGDALEFTCGVGYDIDANELPMICGNGGIWNSSIPTCYRINCSLPAQDHVDYFMNTYELIIAPTNIGYGMSISLSCHYGFKLTGSSATAQCSEQAVWTPSLPRCIPIRCPDPFIHNGRHFTRGDSSSTFVDSVVYFSCNEGYVLKGESTAECHVSGNWSVDLPVCVRINCPLPSIEHAEISSILDQNDDDKYNPGDVITVLCSDGTHLTGSFSNITCESTGQWSNTLPTCTRNECPHVTVNNGLVVVLINGEKVQQGSFYYNDTIEVICNTGYRLVGSSAYNLCTADAEWMDTIQTCDPIRCPVLSIANANFNASHTTYNSQPNVSCHSGYQLKGGPLYCSSGGVWIGSIPSCVKINCPVLNLQNGHVIEQNSSTRQENVRFQCSPGYELIGQEMLSCSLNGSWSGVAPLCRRIHCREPSIDRHHMAFTVSQNDGPNIWNFGTEIEFVCELGYQLIDGDPLLRCGVSKTWVGQVPRCDKISCPSPTLNNGILANHSLNDNKFVFGDRVEFICNEGYRLQGEHELFCQANKEWNGQIPSCDIVSCGKPNAFEHGSYEGNEWIYGYNVTYACQFGYELDSPQMATCLGTGQWSNQGHCIPIICPVPEPLENGSCTRNGNEYGSLLQCKCSVGFLLGGSAVRRCENDRQWTGLLPYCWPVTCGQPPNTPHSNIVGNGILYGAERTIECHSGYQLEGNPRITCTSDGSWSRSLAHCRIIQCLPVQIPTHARQIGFVYTFMSTVSISCNQGYRLVGVSSTTCTATGLWSSNLGTCQKIRCISPSSIDNGYFVTKDGVIIRNSLEAAIGNFIFNYADRIRYGCNIGFTLSGIAHHTCSVYGNWTGRIPKCNKVGCGSLPSVRHGILEPDNRTKFLYGDSVTVRCVRGYELVNDISSIRCMENRTWDMRNVACVEVMCPEPEAPLLGGFNGDLFSFGYRVTFYCHAGYQINGSNAAECLADGTWSGGQRRCTPVQCSIPPNIENGRYIGSNFEYTGNITYECHHGYHLSGPTHIYCLANRTWSQPLPVCTYISCNQPDRIENGHWYGTDFSYGSVVTYACETGFSLVGDSTSYCLSNSMWSSKNPQCVRQTCPSPQNITNGFTIVIDLGLGSRVTFMCQETFTLVGEDTSTCLLGGVWSSAPPHCERNLCPVLIAPVNGFMHGSSRVAGAIIQFDCDRGYELTGSSSVSCIRGEFWNGTYPVCRPRSCGRPEGIPNGEYQGSDHSYKAEVILQCFNGYEIRGVLSRLCLDNGQWSPDAGYCAPVSCKEPPKVSHALPHGTIYTFGHAVTYECTHGYSPVGNTVMRCGADKQWKGEMPHCREILCLQESIPSIDFASHTLLDNYTIGSVVIYSCARGYTLNGPATITCTASGNWQYSRLPICSPVYCGESPTVANTISSATGSSFGHIATYTCLTGFTMIGDRTSECDDTGHWSALPICEIVTCSMPAAPLGGMVDGASNTYGAVIRFSCNTGWRLLGPRTSSCMADGTWSGLLPLCIEIDCGPPPVPQHGLVDSSAQSYGTVVNYACVDGHEMVGANASRCGEDGTWGTLAPTCQPIRKIPCVRPLSDSMVILRGVSFNYGDKARYFCRYGLRPTTPTTITCQHGGKWSHSPNCQARCRTPCKNDGRCIRNNVCKCPDGYTGRHCERVICVLRCLHGGVCVSPYQCQCPHGYTGSRCQQIVCDQPCQHGGYCAAPNRCSCPKRYLPPFCDRSTVRIITE